jgi:hypothetical protein
MAVAPCTAVSTASFIARTVAQTTIRKKGFPSGVIVSDAGDKMGFCGG